VRSRVAVLDSAANASVPSSCTSTPTSIATSKSRVKVKLPFILRALQVPHYDLWHVSSYLRLLVCQRLALHASWDRGLPKTQLHRQSRQSLQSLRSLGSLMLPLGRTGHTWPPRQPQIRRECQLLSDRAMHKVVVTANYLRLFCCCLRCCVGNKLNFKILNAEKVEVGEIVNIYNGCYLETCTK
jgi:hypothetical protein